MRNDVIHMVFARWVLWPLICLCVPISPLTAAEPPTAAILRAGLLGEDNEVVAALQAELVSAGYKVMLIDARTICDPAALAGDAVDLLVLPNAATMPACAGPAIEAYARGGGDILALKAPIFQRSMVNLGGRWTQREQWQIENASQSPPHVIFDFAPGDIVDWIRSQGPRDGASVVETLADGPGPGMRSLHVVSERFDNWDTHGPSAIAAPFPEGHSLTVFSARGISDTREISIEWTEQDGSRWIAVVPLTTQWKRYVLAPRDFHYWDSINARRSTSFNPARASTVRFGIAASHTKSLTRGRHEYWVGSFGTAPLTGDLELLLNDWSLPALDTLSPGYKLFDCHEVAALQVREDQAILEPGDLPMPEGPIRSPHPRPRGGGFDKGRAWRWIPLIEARGREGQWRGTPLTMTVHADGPFKGGVWISCGVDDNGWYRRPEVMGMLGRIVSRIRQGAFLLDGGTDHYTYFEDQPVKSGARAFSLNALPFSELEARVELRDASGQTIHQQQWPVHFEPGKVAVVEASWDKPLWPAEGCTAVAELWTDGKCIDRTVSEANIWRPREDKHFITTRDGEFMLDGQRWRAHGINYMPSSGIGTEDGPYFEHWLGDRAYDSEVIQRDLEHVKDLGFNAVSIFVYHQSMTDQNLLDLLGRLGRLGIKANLSLRPGTPMDFPWPLMRDLITYYRLPEQDVVFALDLAWEPSFGLHEERRPWDAEWAEWIVERYGSIEAAERDWQFSVPRNQAGAITNPASAQIDIDGQWRRMVAAYRRFLDTLLYRKYGAARRLVRGIDPVHLVSFRMSEATNPIYRWDGRITYDFPYLAAAVDMLAPEAYGRIGDWEKVKPGWFQVAYGRWAGPDLPLIWAEAGVSTWSLSRMVNDEHLLDFQARFYADLYRMFIGSGSDGVFFWWYPGGFRYGENSDYGIINPDTTDRPVSKVIREHAERFLNGPSARPVDHWIEIDRDGDPSGISGIYDKVQAEFWQAIEAGQTPGLRTAGTGTTSANCPLLAVGNTPCNGSNPPKYLDGVFDVVEIQDAAGQWIAVDKGGRIEVRADRPVRARVDLTNLGEATWLAPQAASEQAGTIALIVENGTATTTVPLARSVPPRQSTRIKEVMLIPGGLSKETAVSMRLEATGRTAFGERFTLRVVPHGVADSDR